MGTWVFLPCCQVEFQNPILRQHSNLLFGPYLINWSHQFEPSSFFSVVGFNLGFNYLRIFDLILNPSNWHLYIEVIHLLDVFKKWYLYDNCLTSSSMNRYGTIESNLSLSGLLNGSVGDNGHMKNESNGFCDYPKNSNYLF